MAEPDPLGELEFLARSPNRVEVLAVLAEGPRTRRDLAEAVDVSQPTLGRILNDLGERAWVVAEGDRYRTTATGDLVAAGITDLRERLAAEAALRDVVPYLPTDAIDVDLRRFADATITTPTQTRPNRPIRRMLDLLGETEAVLLLSHAFNEQKLRLVRDRSVEGSLRTKGVFGADAIDAVRETPDLRALLADIVATEVAEIRVAADPVPVAVEVTDDRTHLLLRDDEGIVRAALDTDDAAVREWAETLHEEFWTGATTLTAADLAG